MKKTLIKLICFLLVFSCFNTVVLAYNEGISTCANNNANTYTDFTISSSGVANVNVRFVGYEGITTGAQITTKIQKRFLLVFWNDVDGAYWVDNTGSSYFSASHSISVKSGYYRAQVEYVVYVTGGDNNIISEVREAEY